MKNILFALEGMVTVYDSFCESISLSIPVAILDTASWSAAGNRYKSDATLYQNGIMIDVERAECPAFVLAHEFGHIELIQDGIDDSSVVSIREREIIEELADFRAIKILEEAGFEVEENIK